jgi:hypothetical protein
VGFELVREIAAPPCGAGAFNQSVAVVLPPPVSVFGAKLIELTITGLMVKFALRVTPPYEPVIVTVADDATMAATTLNVPLVAP